MAQDPKKHAESQLEDLEIEWGETNQERILDKAPRHESAKSDCKGPACDNAFEKL